MFLFRRVCEKIKSSQESSREEAKVDTFILSRLCYLLGQVALCQLNYLDVVFLSIVVLYFLDVVLVAVFLVIDDCD